MSDAGSWCLIESDPGVFTELIADMGVKGTQVEEIWSLDDETLEELKPIYGLVFLFKWQGGNDSSQPHPDADPSLDSHVFFAKQVITNACATQAILSILLNCPHLEIGPELTNFKEFTRDFDPVVKGLTISNSDVIRTVHNSFARSDPFVSEGQDPKEAEKEDLFHFISYLPILGSLYELDGLSSGPVNLGPCTDDDWLQKVRPVIQERIARYTDSEIRFNLMAVIGNRQEVFRERLLNVEARLTLLQIADKEVPKLREEKGMLQNRIGVEKEKFARYKRENTLRKHNFVPLIYHLLRLLAQRGELSSHVERARVKAREAQERRAQQKRKKDVEGKANDDSGNVADMER